MKQSVDNNLIKEFSMYQIKKYKINQSFIPNILLALNTTHQPNISFFNTWKFESIVRQLVFSTTVRLHQVRLLITKKLVSYM